LVANASILPEKYTSGKILPIHHSVAAADTLIPPIRNKLPAHRRYQLALGTIENDTWTGNTLINEQLLGADQIPIDVRESQPAWLLPDQQYVPLSIIQSGSPGAAPPCTSQKSSTP